MVHFLAVSGANHFSILAPTTHLIASKVLHDEGPAANVACTAEELQNLFGR